MTTLGCKFDLSLSYIEFSSEPVGSNKSKRGFVNESYEEGTIMSHLAGTWHLKSHHNVTAFLHKIGESGSCSDLTTHPVS